MSALSMALLLSASTLTGAAPCRVDPLDCDAAWWRYRGLESPCELSPERLAATFGLPPRAVAAVQRALASCGPARERAWLEAAAEAPGHGLPAWGILRFLPFERARPAFEAVLLRAADPDAFALTFHVGSRLESEALRFLRKRGPRVLAGLARLGVLELDDAERAYAAALREGLPSDDAAALLGVVAVKRLFNEPERPGLPAFLAAQPAPVLDALREGLTAGAQEEPSAAARGALRAEPEVRQGLDVVRALVGAPLPDDGWSLYLALRRREAEAYPLVSERLPAPYARRLAEGVHARVRELRAAPAPSDRRRGEQLALEEPPEERRQRLARAEALAARFTARGFGPAAEGGATQPALPGPGTSAAGDGGGAPGSAVAALEPGEAAIRQALEQPRPLPWREAPPTGPARSPTRVPAPPAQGLPADLRAATPPTDGLLVVTSQRVDPTGETSRGGYWILVGAEGGGWGPPLYTGLRVHRPYEVLGVQRERDIVRLTVRRREIDEATASFPPVGLALRGTGPLRVLECTLAELARDEDGDGLSDVLEGRLFTNPASADTDGDGLTDDVDPVPHVPLERRGAAPTRAKVLDAALRLIELDAAAPVIVSPGSGGLPSMDAPVREARRSGAITFVEGPRSDLRGVDPPGRIIALEARERVAAVARLGAFYPRQLEVELSEDARCAWVRWSDRWRGGELTARLVRGEWRFEILAAWVT